LLLGTHKGCAVVSGGDLEADQNRLPTRRL
jgi:hypothetical protein